MGRKMGVTVDKTLRTITTMDGRKYIQRVRKVLMANGKYRYPTDYIDANTGLQELTEDDLNRIKIPGYPQFV